MLKALGFNALKGNLPCRAEQGFAVFLGSFQLPGRYRRVTGTRARVTGATLVFKMRAEDEFKRLCTDITRDFFTHGSVEEARRSVEELLGRLWMEAFRGNKAVQARPGLKAPPGFKVRS